MRLLRVLLLFCAASPAAADDLVLRPPVTSVAIRAYGLGLIPYDGKFTRFHGVVGYDPQQPGKCQVMLEIDPSSLQMSSQSETERVTGPDFLDVMHYPAMDFSGACHGDRVSGTLNMHGQARPFEFDLHRGHGRTTATGRLARADWGITADPLTVGRTIRIQVDLPSLATGDHT